jgi:PRA1 family protein
VDVGLFRSRELMTTTTPPMRMSPTFLREGIDNKLITTMTADASRPTFDIEYVRLYLSSLAARVKIENIRPLPVFLGLSSTTTDGGVTLSEGAFVQPSLSGSGAAMPQMKARVNDNLKFFLSNYAMVAAMTALVVLLMHPSVVITLTLIYTLWWLHGYLIVNELTVFTVQVHSVLTVQQRFYLLFGISAVVIVWTCFVPTIIFTVISSIIILCHAALRDTAHLHEVSQRGVKSRDGASKEDTGNEAEGLLSKV